MSGALVNILNKVLGSWIEDLNSEQFSLSIFSGTVELENLKLKPDIFQVLGLPIKLLTSKIGRIQIKIPWSSWYSNPLVVNIEDLNIFLAPNSPDNWNEHDARNLIIKNKNYLLQQFEAIHEDGQDFSSSFSFLGSISSKIIDNLCVNIKNFYVRYEDSSSFLVPFTIGCYMKELDLFNCSEDWQVQNAPMTEDKYKLMLVDHLAIFLDYEDGIVISDEWYEGSCGEVLNQLADDEYREKICHKFILHPFSSRLELILSKPPANDLKPKISVKVLTNLINLDMNTHQILLLVKFQKFLTTYTNYIKGIERELLKKKLDIEGQINYQASYRKYRKNAKENKISQEKLEKLKKKLEKLEEGVSTQEILIERRHALMELKITKLQQEKEKEVNTFKNESSRRFTHKLVDFFNRKTDEQIKQEEHVRKQRVTIAEKDLQRVFMRTNSIIKQVSSNLTDREPETMIKWLIEMNIGKISVILKEDETDYFNIEIYNIFIKTLVRPYSQNLSFSMSNLWIFNLFGKSDLHPKFLDGKELIIQYDTYGNKYLKVASSGLSICLDLDSILHIVCKIQQSFATDKDWIRYLEEISDKTDRYIEQGSHYLMEAFETGVSSKYILDIDIKAPFIIIPNDILDPMGSMIMIDFGKLSAHTDNKVLAQSDYHVYNFVLGDIQISCENMETKFNQILEPTKTILEIYTSENTVNDDPHLCYRVVVDRLKTQFNEKIIEMIGGIYRKYNEVSSMFFSNSESLGKVSSSTERKQDAQRSLNQIQINEISMMLALEDKPQLSTFVQRIKIRVHELGNAKRKIKVLLGSIGFTDLRNDLVSPVYLLEDKSLGNSQSYQFILSGTVDNSKNITDLALKVSNIVLNLEINFLQFLGSTYSKLLSNFSDSSISLRPTISLSRPSITFTTNTRVSCQIENFSLKLLVNESNSWSSLDTLMNLSITLILEQKIEKRINKYLVEVWRQLVESKLETNMMLNHFQLNLTSGSYNKTLIKSSRISIDYTKLTSHGGIPETHIQTRMESLQLVLGFRDFDYLLKVKSKWFLYLFPKTNQVFDFTSDQIIDFDCLQITIQEDTIPEPYSLAFLQFSNFLYTISNSSGDYKCLLNTVFFINFYNRLNGIWEPFIEDWKFLYSYSQKSQNHPMETCIDSRQPMNVNITKEMCETLGVIYTRFYQSPKDWHPVESSTLQPKQGVDYEFINKLGIDLQVYFLDPNLDSFSLPSGESHTVQHLDIKKIFSKKRPKNKFEAGKQANPLACLLPAGYAQVAGLTLEDVGSESFSLLSQNERVNCRKYIKMEKDLRQIWFFRDLVIQNSSSVEIVLFHEFEKEVVNDKDFYLPLTWDLKSVKVKTYRGLRGISTSENLEIEENVFVYLKTGPDLTCLSSISFLPPYSLTNLLPCLVHIWYKQEKVLSVFSGQTSILNFISYNEDSEFILELDLYTCSIYSTQFSINQDLKTISLSDRPAWQIQATVTCSDLSASLKLFSQYLLINSSEFALSLEGMQVQPNELCFFTSTSEELRLKTCGEFDSKLSSSFNPKAVGVSSCLLLPIHNPVVKTLALGLQVKQASSPMVHSKIIKIVPRFVVINYLDFKIYLKQLCKISTRIVEVEPGKHIFYQFDDIEQGSVVQVSEDKLQWSGPFDLSVFDDFQVRFKAAPRDIPAKTNIFAFDSYWYLSCPRNHLYFYIRVNVTSDDEACIRITFSLPLIPAFRIYNSLQEPLLVKQSKTKTEAEVIPAGTSLPWAFFDNTVKNKKVTLRYGKFKKRYSLEKIKEKNKDLGPFLVSIDFEGECRLLRVYEAEETFSHLEIGIIKKVIEKSIRKMEVSLVGIHFSLLDEGNNEKFLVSLKEVNWKSTRNEDRRNKVAKIRMKYHLILAGIQIDNMKIDRYLFPVMAFHLEVNHKTPFCEFRYDREFTTGSIESKYFTPIDRILEFELQMQPLNLNLNLETLFSFITLSDLYYKHFYRIQVVELVRSRCLVAEVYPDLCTYVPIPKSCPQVIKSYFKYIRIHGTKLILTFSNTDSTSQTSRSEVSHSISEFMLDLANIENSNLKFTEIILQYSFQNFSNLFTLLTKNYVRQGLLQFYRILGSSELLGNPIGLIDKLGTGVYEFFNEPAKGLLQGPKGFVSGVGKGVKSLVSNVIGGSFESVSKITGSLYKIVGQDKQAGNSITQKLGINDLTSGVAGIVIKPYEGLKTRGAAGLMIGVGSGVFGALVSPVAAVLHFSATVSSEVAKTANKLHNSQSHRGRVRFPRFLSNKKILEHYDHNQAKIRYFLALKEFKEFDILALIELVREYIIVTKDKLFVLVGEEIVEEHVLSQFYIKEVHQHHRQFILKLAGEGSSVVIGCELYAPIYRLFNAVKLSNRE